MADARQELLRKAADLIGKEKLAIGLKVSKALLDSWINGHSSMPTRKLSELSDLLDEISSPPRK
jgi:hypothetical protein